MECKGKGKTERELIDFSIIEIAVTQTANGISKTTLVFHSANSDTQDKRI